MRRTRGWIISSAHTAISAQPGRGASNLGLPEVNAPFRGWKITLFEGGIGVPMFVKWQGRIAPGTVVDDPVAHVDVFPPLAAAGGASLPEGRAIDGRNMLPVATGEASAIQRDKDAIFWSSGFYKLVRAGDWKLQLNERQDRRWLFNLAEDPTEQVNLAGTRPDKLAEAHWAEAREPLYPHLAESAICIDKTIVDRTCENEEYVIWPN